MRGIFQKMKNNLKSDITGFVLVGIAVPVSIYLTIEIFANTPAPLVRQMSAVSAQVSAVLTGFVAIALFFFLARTSETQQLFMKVQEEIYDIVKIASSPEVDPPASRISKRLESVPKDITGLAIHFALPSLILLVFSAMAALYAMGLGSSVVLSLAVGSIVGGMGFLALGIVNVQSVLSEMSEIALKTHALATATRLGLSPDLESKTSVSASQIKQNEVEKTG